MHAAALRLRAGFASTRARCLAAVRSEFGKLTFGLLVFGVPGAALPSQSEPPSAAVHVDNSTETDRRELVRVSVPWPRGALPAPTPLRVGEDVAPSIALMRWPDGSVRLSQAHAVVTLAPGANRLPIEIAAQTAMPDGARSDARPPASLPVDWPSLRAELTDAWSRPYAATLSRGDWQLLPGSSTDRLAVYWCRLPLLAVANGGDRPETVARLGAVRAWLTWMPSMHRAELTVALANDPLADEPVVGPMRFESFAVAWQDSRLRVLPREREAQLLQRPQSLRGEGTGGFRQLLLGPSRFLYLGDRTAKTFRLDLVRPPEGAEIDDRERLRRSVESRLVAFPDLDWTRHTGAFGAHGGPAPLREPLAAARARAAGLAAGLRQSHGVAGGPFASFGDPRDAGDAAGTLRNGAGALHNVLRWRSVELAEFAEAMALQQSLRPPPGAVPRQPPATAHLRQGLSSRAIDRPHGFTACDYEHCSLDLLFDHYWLTGDPAARFELRRAAAALPGLLANVPFRTSRGEGWCMQAAVLASVAAGEPELLDPVADRFLTDVLPELGVRSGGAHALAQPPHPRVLGQADSFEAPWQMAALIHGMAALDRQRPSGELDAAIVAAGESLAGPGRDPGVGAKEFFVVGEPQRFQLRIDGSARGGTAWQLIGALTLAAERVEQPEGRKTLREYADVLVRSSLTGDRLGPAVDSTWFQLFFDRYPEFR